MKKRALSVALMLTLCMSLSVIGVSAAESDFVIKDVHIQGSGTFRNVLMAYNGPGGNVVIPEGVRYVGLGIGLETRGIGASVFAGRQDITGVSIPNSAVFIGTGAFMGCTGLTSLKISDGVKDISNEAFLGCTGLTNLTIPGNVKEISTAAFYGCTGLTSLTLREGIEVIGGDSFRGCTGLTSVSFPDSVTTIKALAFEDCANLADIRIPETADIEGNPFEGTAWMEKQGDWVVLNGTLLSYKGSETTVSIPNTVTAIGGSWYDGGYWDERVKEWRGLERVVIPRSVTKIKYGAFWHCTEMKSIDIPDSVTHIGVRAFADTGLAKVVIPDSVTFIGSAAFEECYELTSIEIPSSVTKIGAQDDRIPVFDRAPNVTIHGVAGSRAQTYAKEHRIPFVADLSPKVAGFNDVRESDVFADAIRWSVEKGIATGTSKTAFSPSTACSRAQVLTFLWRSQGEPEPGIENPFSDVSGKNYYYKAALWAYEKGLIGGTAFQGDTPCTRGDAVSYLWKLAGSPSVSPAKFSDVADTADYAQAVAWAVEKGVTSGTSKTMFSPEVTCTRGQIVTFLYRAYK